MDTLTRPSIPGQFTPAALEVVARAEKRMRGHITVHGIDAEALAIFATYERMYAAAVHPAPVETVDDRAAEVALLLSRNAEQRLQVALAAIEGGAS